MSLRTFSEWLATAPASKLEIERSRLNQWLGLPGSELWADQYAENKQRHAAIAREIRRRKARMEQAA